VTVIPEVYDALTTAGVFKSVDEAEALVGFDLLRPEALQDSGLVQSGIVETYPEIGLPRVRQVIAIAGHERGLHFVQQPLPYASQEPPGTLRTAEFGRFEGKLWQWGSQIGFRFETGARVRGTPVIGEVWGEGFTVEEISHFVDSLTN
jgi:hypothetical protein